MKIRKIIIVFLSFYISSVTAQKIVTVSEAIELALENNYGILGGQQENLQKVKFQYHE